MTVNIELENAEDFPFIKELLEKLKGVKSVSVQEDEEFYEDGTPKWFIERLADYADRLEEKDMISEEEFFKYVDDQICRLNSQK
ncbi:MULTISPECIES: hypothetical protein [Chryseobacterium]|uniref:Ribosome assembly protein YihI (Activator of Der GTPase) n=1 Tax=Chryseobacterium camelliae TaxID=1265445 RepID=A0ABU0TKH6_9FLAO|nr:MULTISPECIES: hypothetical protein [Chryseobacterium]MDT3408586.1 ribosome assembly protein YihI (activator of Der GTPase) [Pseudacidovorax intermedius]MDQ1097559.1 ribosome assembly protein YihI (activator of Der GTPase) [Chryseobacterium camelliae]MDQ1101488.1 ribosome assembly protein YihI (activator of Der GTPase) [Chryseobacterium sp. SORGH_AS_1048]MDR6084931.1 ribosome assembly protein YihI (activator of Der GTPase) [Chryseobacterium sp. SORGH_AS_0909]MDR6129284.1 ribosome assembly pr